TGGIGDWYPRTIASWRAAHPDDAALDALADRFCASPACAAWRELPAGAPGMCLEEALHRFFEAEEIGGPIRREGEFLAAIVQALVVAPEARFAWPAVLRRAPGGCFAIGRAGTIHAALDGRYVTGPVTPLITAILTGAPGPDPDDAAVAPVRAALSRLRL